MSWSIIWKKSCALPNHQCKFSHSPWIDWNLLSSDQNHVYLSMKDGNNVSLPHLRFNRWIQIFLNRMNRTRPSHRKCRRTTDSSIEIPWYTFSEWIIPSFNQQQRFSDYRLFDLPMNYHEWRVHNIWHAYKMFSCKLIVDCKIFERTAIGMYWSLF